MTDTFAQRWTRMSCFENPEKVKEKNEGQSTKISERIIAQDNGLPRWQFTD
jgi:hypothetical protein